MSDRRRVRTVNPKPAGPTPVVWFGLAKCMHDTEHAGDDAAIKPPKAGL
jgi:hypothetical protein